MALEDSANLVEYFRSQLEPSLALLKKLVELESYSFDKPGVDGLTGFLADEFSVRGASVEVMEHPVRGNALKATWNDASAEPPVLVLGHLDTVWPPGTLRSRPFKVEEGKAYGPGVFDMKSGILICLLACQAFQERRIDPGKGVIFLFTADEEIGTETGLSRLKLVATSCRAVLCLEPPLPGGKVKTFRKGVGEFRIRVTGVAAHAGADHEKGANAILELSKLVLQLQALTDYQRGVTVNVGKIRGGSAVNVVPADAEAEVDFRVSTVSDGDRLEQRVRGLRASDPRCAVLVEGGLRRPPLERTPAVVELYQKARGVAFSLGLDLGEGGTGGASDGSFTAAWGIPTLDGLGVEGDGAHALHEHILVDDIPRRAALLARLTQTLPPIQTVTLADARKGTT